jgi:hypothetical protein
MTNNPCAGLMFLVIMPLGLRNFKELGELQPAKRPQRRIGEVRGFYFVLFNPKKAF